jgi:hypothetical protein
MKITKRQLKRIINEELLSERGSGNPALRAEEQAITRSVADFVDKYMMTMGLNPGSDADMKKARRVVDDVVTAVMDVL